MKLIKATNDNFRDMEAQWAGQLSKYDDTIEDYLAPIRDHSKSIVNADYEDLAVYLLENNGAYEGYMHLNWAQIKRLPGYTLRVREVMLAPVYDYEEVSTNTMGAIIAGVFTECFRLSEQEYKSNQIKIHLGPLDKGYLSAFSTLFAQNSNGRITAEMQGLWLVVTKS